MASSKGYLDYVLEQLSALDGLTGRAMMGEYVLYYGGKVVGGIYDGRLLLKMTEGALRLTQTPQTDIPYPGAKAHLVANPDDAELTCRLITAIAADLTESKPRRNGNER